MTGLQEGGSYTELARLTAAEETRFKQVFLFVVVLVWVFFCREGLLGFFVVGFWFSFTAWTLGQSVGGPSSPLGLHTSPSHCRRLPDSSEKVNNN